MRDGVWRRIGAVLLGLQAAYNAFFALGPLSAAFSPSGTPFGDSRAGLLQEAMPMIGAAVVSGLLAVLVWRRADGALPAAVIFTAIESMVGLFFVGIGFGWGLAGLFYMLLPLPGPPVLVWPTLGVLLVARRRSRRPARQASVAAGEGADGGLSG